MHQQMIRCRGRCFCLGRTRIGAVSVRRFVILFLVASAHASFLVRFSFGNAFVLAPSPFGSTSHRPTTATTIIVGTGVGGGVHSWNDSLQTKQEHPSRSNNGRSLTRPSTTTAFVFSRLGDGDGVSGSGTGSVPSRRNGHGTTTPKRNNSKSNSSSKNSSRKRTATPTPTTRGYCPRCKRPGVVCICHALPDAPIDCGARILILQHPREAKKRKRTSTVPLIGLSVGDVAICVGTTFDEGSHPLLDEALALATARRNCNNTVGDGDALLLYPSERALPLQTYLEDTRNRTTSRETETPQPTGPDNSNSSSNSINGSINGSINSINNDNDNDNGTTNSSRSRSSRILVVVDGTWAQTQSMVQNSHATLRNLPNVMFDDDTDSLFDSLRQEPAKHCTSTLEAVSRAIRLLGAFPPLGASSESSSSNGTSNGTSNSAGAADALERSLKAMVDGQLKFALDQKIAKPRYFRKNEPTSKEHDTETNNNNNERSRHNNNNNNNNNNNSVVSKREAKRTRKMVSRSLRAGLALPQPKTEEELEFERIRFVYVAHLG